MMNATRSDTITINGAKLYYELAGSGPAIALLHAGIADRRMWDGQFDLLAEKHTVLRYDLRGYGLSDPIREPFAHHEDLRGLLDALGIERAALIGCSMGGGAAIDFTLEYPTRTAALVTVAPGLHGYMPEGGFEEPPLWNEIVEAFQAKDLGRVAELETQLWIDGPRRRPEQVDPAVRQKVIEMNLIALRHEFADLGPDDPAPTPAAERFQQIAQPPAGTRLEQIACPVLVILGTEDEPIMTTICETLRERIAGAQMAVIENAGHLPNMEHPETFNRLVLGFLDGIGG
jgi:pimeloyl-ACP methyl ester carboxylesterase